MADASHHVPVETLSGGEPRARTFESRVIAHNRLSETGHELVLERNGLVFEPGMLLTVHGRDVTEDREYTITGGTQDKGITLLYRWIPTGRLTSQLVRLQAGNTVRWTAPHGAFTLRDSSRHVVFVATGTGIAPCRSYFRSHPELNLPVYHGVRRVDDLFYREELESADYRPCISGPRTRGLYAGRVTDRFRESEIDLRADYYLCGAYEMIFDVTNLLHQAAVPPSQIFTEPYYYKG